MQTKGRSLANVLEEAIQAIENDSGDERDRAAVVEEMGEAAGIDPSTVNSILSANIECPPRRRLNGFASVDGMPSFQALSDAAESDGCNVSESEESGTPSIADHAETMSCYLARARKSIEKWRNANAKS